MFVAQAIVFNNQMFTLPSHPGENSTYQLQFRGPHFRCTTTRYNSTIALDYKPWGYIEALEFTTAWDRERLIQTSRQFYITSYTVKRELSGDLVGEATCMVEEQICIAQSVLYNVSITFPRGVQTVDCFFSDLKALPRKVDPFGAELYLKLELPPEIQALHNWYQILSTSIPASNEWALLDALGALIEGKSFQGTYPSLPSPTSGYPAMESPTEQGHHGGSNCHQRAGSSSTTPVYDCDGWWRGFDNDTENCKSLPIAVQQCNW